MLSFKNWVHCPWIIKSNAFIPINPTYIPTHLTLTCRGMGCLSLPPLMPKILPINSFLSDTFLLLHSTIAAQHTCQTYKVLHLFHF